MLACLVKLFLAHLVEMVSKKSLRGRHIGPLTKLSRTAANLNGQHVGHHVFYYIMKKKHFFKSVSIQLRPRARGRQRRHCPVGNMAVGHSPFKGDLKVRF